MIKSVVKTSMAIVLAVGVATVPVLAESNAKVSPSELSELTKKQKAVLEVAEEIEQILIERGLSEENQRVVRAIDDSNTAKLRSGNFIEGILDSKEGLSTKEIAIIYDIGTEATETAKKTYKNDSQLRDAYRHFIWNYNSSNHKKIGKSKTRIATVNHEWGLLLIDDAVDHYDRAYQKYLRLGAIGSQAMNAAFADTLNELPKMKKNKIDSYSDFTKIVTKGNIMDWNNNYFGIYYSYVKDVNDAFKQAKPFLILAESKVGTSEYRNVYKGNYWK